MATEKAPHPDDSLEEIDMQESKEKATREQEITEAAENIGEIAVEESVEEPRVEPENIEVFVEAGEEILEDTDETLADTVDSKSGVREFLREAGVDKAKADEIIKILDSSQAELVRLHLSNLEVPEEKIDSVADLLVPLHLYLKKLEELGMAPDKGEEAHGYLVNEVGRTRLNHLMELVGGHEEELRSLMKKDQVELLAQELKKMGFEDDKVLEIAATPRRNRDKLIQEVLKGKGLGDRLIEGVQRRAALSEVPAEIADKAITLGIPLETLIKAREAFSRAEWKETLEYLKLAESDEGVREYLRELDIHIGPVVESDVEKKSRENEKRLQLARMLEKFKEYLPLQELPLPDDVEIPPGVNIPDDLLGAYGLWRLLLTNTYKKRLNDKVEYKGVRSELQRIGGKVPIIRGVRQRILAFRILQKQKQNNPNGNYGPFSLGIKRYKENFRWIEEADIQVINARRALDVIRRNNFISDGQATPRTRLAETIIDIRLREIAFSKAELNARIPKTGDMPGEEVPKNEELV